LRPPLEAADSYPELMRELTKSFRATAEALQTTRPALERRSRDGRQV